MQECLAAFTRYEQVEGVTCSACAAVEAEVAMHTLLLNKRRTGLPGQVGLPLPDDRGAPEAEKNQQALDPEAKFWRSPAVDSSVTHTPEVDGENSGLHTSELHRRWRGSVRGDAGALLAGISRAVRDRRDREGFEAAGRRIPLPDIDIDELFAKAMEILPGPPSPLEAHQHRGPRDPHYYSFSSSPSPPLRKFGRHAALKRVRLYRLPSVLVIQLQRSVWSSHLGRTVKVR